MKKWIEPQIEEISIEAFGGISLFGTCYYSICGKNFSKTNAADKGCGGYYYPNS